MPIYLYTYLPIYPYTHIPIYLYTYIPIYTYTYIQLYCFPHTYITIYLYTYIPIYLYSCVHIYPYIQHAVWGHRRDHVFDNDSEYWKWLHAAWGDLMHPRERPKNHQVLIMTVSIESGCMQPGGGNLMHPRGRSRHPRPESPTTRKPQTEKPRDESAPHRAAPPMSPSLQMIFPTRLRLRVYNNQEIQVCK